MSTVTKRTRSVAIPMIAVSLALHGAAWAAVARVRPAPLRERIELEVVSRPRTAPAAVPLPAAPPPERRSARPTVASARTVPTPPALASAPQTPPPGAPRALPRVGLSLGSTVSSGGFAIGVGNTAYGKAEETAPDPSSVRPYAGGVVPAARLTVQPRPVHLPRIEYPRDARKEGIEGQVALLLRIDAGGAVVSVRVVAAPSPSLAAAAEEGARAFLFSPALVQGEPVATEIRFTYTFLLE